MDSVRVTIDAGRAMEAFRAAPEVMSRHVDEALEAGAQYVAREAKRGAPTFQSTLVNSIRAERVPEALPPGVLAWQARTGVNYARYVEEGIGPMLNSPPGMSNGLLEWIRAKFAPENDEALVRIYWAVAFAIQRRGVKPRPFMAPAMEASEARVRQMVRQSVQAGIAEVFGGG